MKKRLLFQSIAAFAVSAIITLLIGVCVMNMLGNINFLPVRQGSISSKVIVYMNGETLYSSEKLSPFELKDIYLAAMEKNPVYTYKKVSYRIEKQVFADGAEMVRLNPRIDFYKSGMYLFVFFIAVLAVVYMIAVMFFQRTNDREIIKPLNDLKRQTQLLQEGSYDINIPDEGRDEINELCLAVEALRLRLKEEIYRNRRSDEERQFLISSVSHDLRTPVTSVRGYLEGILDGVADTEEKRELYIKKSIEKIDIINHMIGDLLLYSKLNSNQIEFKYQTIDIAEYLSAFVADSRRIFEREEKQIEFINELKVNYNVKIDVQQFDRVMRNLTENALKYIDKGTGRTEVILRQNISSVLIEVKDNGPGIDEKNIHKIFDRFYRCESSRAVKGSSGLGLAISKQIVESMNGRIWAVSRKGEGTSLIISLWKEPETSVQEKHKV